MNFLEFPGKKHGILTVLAHRTIPIRSGSKFHAERILMCGALPPTLRHRLWHSLDFDFIVKVSSLAA